MSTPLSPGDRCYYLSPKGKKLRCLVVESLKMKTRGQDEFIPVTRAIARRSNKSKLDNPGAILKEPRIIWKPRSELRKLPTK